ncbi:MAG: glutamate 5-kinase [Desulfobacterota bacterium]|nr:glutamate 5-kinase [Thermodesulfobacteriota bacterium]
MPTQQLRRDIITKVRRAVVKLGSYVLTTPSWKLDRKVFVDITRSIAHLAQSRGIQSVIVTSGAVATGMGKLGFKERPRALAQEQAAAAVGQIGLMALYERLFARHGMNVGQMLLTHGDLRDRKRFLTIRDAMESLLELGVVPIINENDSVVVDEIKFGDNDYLSSLVTNVAQADLLIILTDIDGVYDKDPHAAPDARLIQLIQDVDTRIEQLAGAAHSTISRGGMASKIKAAKTAALFGVPTIIANGKQPGILLDIFSAKQVGTLILPKENKLTSRKHWIAFTLKPQGIIQVDAGAEAAMVGKGRSLLPSGIVGVKGTFGPGEAVSCCTSSGHEFARGITAYSSEDIEKIKGLKTSQIQNVLGRCPCPEVIHRDDLVILKDL